jgi:hypothetical protein
MSLGTFAGVKQMKLDAGEVTLGQFNDSRRRRFPSR